MHKNLPSSATKNVQSVAGSFSHGDRALKSSMLIVLNDIGTTQDNPTERAQEECQQLMDYAAAYPNIIIRHCASCMVLLVDSDAACQVLSKAKSRTSGYFYLSNHPSKTNQPMLNSPALVACKTI